MFLNKSPIHWYSKQQATVQSSSFTYELCDIHLTVEMVKVIRYKIQMFGITINISQIIFLIIRKSAINCASRVYSEKEAPLFLLALVGNGCMMRQFKLKIKVMRSTFLVFTDIFAQSRRQFLLGDFTYCDTWFFSRQGSAGLLFLISEGYPRFFKAHFVRVQQANAEIMCKNMKILKNIQEDLHYLRGMYQTWLYMYLHWR